MKIYLRPTQIAIRLSLLLYCCLASSSISFTQSLRNEGCGNEEASLIHQKEYAQSNRAVNCAYPNYVVPPNWRSTVDPAVLEQIFTVPIQFHLMRTDEGYCSTKVSDLDVAIAELNTVFTPINIQFTQCGPPNVIDNDDFNRFLHCNSGHPVDYSDLFQYQVSNAINIYVFSQFHNNLCNLPAGQSSFPFESPTNPFIFINGCVSPLSHVDRLRLLVHEMGHHFGLYHTHENYLTPSDAPFVQVTRELVIRDYTAGLTFEYPNHTYVCPNDSPYGFELRGGDLIEGTEADNFGGYWSEDPNGQSYTPPINNYMSYYVDTNEFTTDQYDRMQYYFLHYLTYLDNTLCQPDGEPLTEEVVRIDLNGNATPVNNVNLSITHSIETDCSIGSGYFCQPADPTNAQGQFTCNFPSTGFAQSDLEKADDWANGVTTFDLHLIQQHILDVNYLNGWGQIAADANNNGNVSTFDVVLIRKQILGYDAPLPETYFDSPWRFFPEFIPEVADVHFIPNKTQTPFNIMDFVYPEYLESHFCYELPELSLNQRGFHAVKVGDVNGSANTQNLTGQASDRSQSIIHLDRPSAIPAGQQITVSFTADRFEDISAFGLGFYLDPEALEVEAVIPGELPNYQISDFGTTRLAKGELRTLWLDEKAQGQDLAPDQALFHLNLRTLAPIENLQRHIQLNESILTPEFISSHTALVGNRLSMQVAEIIVDPPSSVGLDLRVAPNPFEEELNFQFNAPQREEVRLQIYDVLGRLVFAQTYETEIGAQQLSVEALGDLPKGALWYDIQGKNWAERGKLLHW